MDRKLNLVQAILLFLIVVLLGFALLTATHTLSMLILPLLVQP